jgi:hypothetical protein
MTWAIAAPGHPLRVQPENIGLRRDAAAISSKADTTAAIVP